MTNPDLPAKFGNDAVLSAVTPGGLPYPVSSDPANQGANAIKALALALDTQAAGPWVALVMASGVVSNGAFCRVEGASVAFTGYISQAAAFTGGQAIFTIPSTHKPVMPSGSPVSYVTAIGPAVTSGNAAYATMRLWASNGAASITAMQGSLTNIDLTGIRYSIRNG